MELHGYRLSPLELAGVSLTVGVLVATVTLFLNLLWESIKHVTGRFTPHGTRRCVVCMEPAEPGSCLCHQHAELSSIVRRRSNRPSD